MVAVSRRLAGGRAALRSAAFGLLVGLAANALGAGATSAGEEREPRLPASPTLAPSAEGVHYRTRIEGVVEPELASLLAAASQLVALEARPPPSLAALAKRAERDLERLAKALRSEGFYGARLAYAIDRTSDPPTVVVTVDTGVLYLLGGFEIEWVGPPPDESVRPSLEALGLVLGMAARAPAIQAAERGLLAHLGERGHPFARVVERHYEVDHATTTLTARLRVDAGPFTRFGPLALEGLVGADPAYVRGLIAWREGAPWDDRHLEAARRALAETGLFTGVVIEPAATVEADGLRPVTVRLTEAPQRSIGFGASYSTSEGFGGEAFWEHRNLLGRQERLRLTAMAAEIEQGARAEFEKPRFLRRDQALAASAAVANRTTDAFDERSLSGAIGLDRTVGAWRSHVGLAAELSIQEDEGGQETFQLLGLPLALGRDSSDDPLDPSRGGKFRLALTPYGGAGEEGLLFAVATLSAAAYRALDDEGRLVLAGRAKIGSVVGEDTAVVPANKRLYAGGGGSIRGYAFQSVGPLDDEREPLGGRSLLELNAELRWRLAESFGIVPFIDGGSAFDAVVPDFGETVRWAAGLGLRYYTDFGPIRLDVAVPLNKRAIDDDFELYISIGQAF